MRRLGCVLSQFPRYDEAFILRELTALSQGPQELVIFSLRPCLDRVIHEQAKALQPRTVYAPFLWSAAVWRSHAHFLRRAPLAYWGALGWIVRRHWNHPVILVKTLAFFPKTVHFARLAQERGVSHMHAFWATYPAACAMLINRLTGIPFSLSGHAHDLYTTNPTLAEKVREARFVVTCTEENQRYLEGLVNGYPAGDEKPGTPKMGTFLFFRPPLRHKGLAKNRNVPVSSGTGRPASPSSFHALSPRVSGENDRNVVVPHGRKVIVSYHGVDLARFQALPKPDGAECRLLVVGSLLPCKGLETLVEACRALKARGVSFHCTMAGGGPLERSLARLIRRYGLTAQVDITGYASQERVAALYQASHLFVLPLVSKIHWGIPNVLIEALATKTPVITCDLPSLKELVAHGESGWLVPESDPDALAAAIETLWADRPLRERLAETGYRRVVERFALERTGERLRQTFLAHLSDA